MTLNRQQRAIIHIAKTDRAFSDDAYRSALAQICGVTISAELDHDGFLAMMGFFDFCGLPACECQGRELRATPGHGVLCPDRADPGPVGRIHPSGL